MDALGLLHEQLAEAEPDLLREMVRSFAEALMGAETDALCAAGFRESSGERVNCRNGYRERPFDTRAGTIMLLPSDLKPPISRAEITAGGGHVDGGDPRERPALDSQEKSRARREYPEGRDLGAGGREKARPYRG
jgi:hypothetical protein